jgi:hypothetical protein
MPNEPTPAPATSAEVPVIPGATASSPAAAAANAAAAVKAQKQPLNDAFSEIDRLVAAKKEPPKTEKKATAKPQNVKPVHQESKTVELGKTKNPEPWEPEPEPTEAASKHAKDEPEAEPDEKTQEADEKPPEGDQKGKKPSPVESLRNAYEKTKARMAELEAEVKRYKESPPEDPEKKTLAERLETIDKRRAELEDELRFANYERHPEYREKYQTPIENALKSAYADVVEFEVATAEGETRKATPDDFNLLVNMPAKQALTVAKEMFGDAASEVLAHRRRIIELENTRKSAIEEYRKKGSEREAAAAETRKKNQERIAKAWETHTKEAVEKYPDWFKPEEGDEDGNRLLEGGFKLADLAFTGMHTLSPDEMVKVHAAVRNKAAGFDRMVLRVKRLNDRVKELETELGEFKESEPAKGEGSREKTKAAGTWEDEIDAMARAH